MGLSRARFFLMISQMELAAMRESESWRERVAVEPTTPRARRAVADVS
jgi:hypothetical protein